MRKIDEYVIEYAYEDDCVKIEKVKSVKKCSQGEGSGEGRSHKNTLFCMFGHA